MMYQFFQELGLKATDEALARVERLIGHPPRRFEDFVAETAAAWGSGAG